MAPEVKIIMTAVDNAGKTIQQLSGKISGLKDELGKAQKPSKDLFRSFTDISSAFNMASGAAGQIIDIYKQVGQEIARLINQAADYSLEMNDLSKVTGMSVEETSRLVQVADDWRVSSGAVTQAMKMMVKNGFEPSIESLADLADKYREIEDPNERATVLTELMGRNWTELIPLLEAGGDAIRKNADAIDDALIVTEKNVEAAREYKKALDDINDSWAAIETSVGQTFLPLAADWLKVFAETIEIVKGGRIPTLAFFEALTNGASQADAAAYAIKELNYAMGISTMAARDHALALSADADAMDEVASRYQPYIDALDEGQNVIEQHRLAQSLANEEAARAAELFDMQAEAARNLVTAQETLAEAQANWSQSVGTDLATQLEKAVGDTDKFYEALKIVDDVMGTNTLTAQKQEDKIADLVEKYGETGNLEEFRSGIEKLKQEFLPLDEQVLKAQSDVDKLTNSLDALNNKHITTYLDVIIQQHGNLPGGGTGSNTGGGGGSGGVEQDRAPQLGGGSGPLASMTGQAILGALAGLMMSATGQRLNATRRSGRGIYGGT